MSGNATASSELRFPPPQSLAATHNGTWVKACFLTSIISILRSIPSHGTLHQSQGSRDPREYAGYGQASVDLHQHAQFIVEFQKGLGAVVVVLNSPAQDIGFRVGTLGVSGTPSGDAALAHPLDHHIIRWVDVDHLIDVPVLPEELGLCPRSRESIQHEPVVPVVLLQPSPYHVHHDVVWNQVSRVEDRLDTRRQLGSVLQMPADDLAHGDMNKVEPRCQHAALCGLARALRADENVLVQGAPTRLAAASPFKYRVYSTGLASALRSIDASISGPYLVSVVGRRLKCYGCCAHDGNLSHSSMWI